MKLSTPTSDRLRRALYIPDARNETAEGVVARMEILMDEFERTPSCAMLIPFLHTYLLITKAVVRERLHFVYPRELETFDVSFAHHYFRPLEQFLFADKLVAPWSTYYQYCSRPDGSAFVQMLLGINAHINGDLGRTLFETSYRRRKDFLHINTILENEIPRVLRYLAFTHKDAISMGGLVWRQFIKREFTRVVVAWRQDAWSGARAMRTGRATSRQLMRGTEHIAEELIVTFEDLYRLRRVAKRVRDIEGLRLRL
jgi:hypothetical protein